MMHLVIYFCATIITSAPTQEATLKQHVDRGLETCTSQASYVLKRHQVEFEFEDRQRLQAAFNQARVRSERGDLPSAIWDDLVGPEDNPFRARPSKRQNSSSILDGVFRSDTQTHHTRVTQTLDGAMTEPLDETEQFVRMRRGPCEVTYDTKRSSIVLSQHTALRYWTTADIFQPIPIGHHRHRLFASTWKTEPLDSGHIAKFQWAGGEWKLTTSAHDPGITSASFQRNGQDAAEYCARFVFGSDPAQQRPLFLEQSLAVNRLPGTKLRLTACVLTDIRFSSDRAAPQVRIAKGTRAWDIRQEKQIYLATDRSDWPVELTAALAAGNPVEGK